MKYGYARVSTPLQSTDGQVAALKQLGVPEHNISEEVVSGRAKKRPKLEELKQKLQEGDELYIVKLDRLGRSAEELAAIAHELQAKGVALVVNGEKQDPTTTTGKLFFRMLAAFAEYEADLISDRTKERLEYLSAQGKRLGRKPALSEQQVKIAVRLHEHGESVSQIAVITGVSRAAVRHALTKAEVLQRVEADPALKRYQKLVTKEREAMRAELRRATVEKKKQDELERDHKKQQAREEQ